MSASVTRLLSRLRALDVQVWAEGGKLRYRGPAGAVDEELRAALAAHKPEILAFLAEAGTGVSVGWDRGACGPGADPPAGVHARRTDSAVLRALEPAAEEFRASLHGVGLLGLLAAYGRSGVRGEMVAQARQGMTGELATAVDLLCLSRPVPLEAARRVVPPPLLDHMAAAGLVQADGGQVHMRAARLVEHYGHPVVVGLPGSSLHGYYGPDSVGLGRLLLGASGRCLDLMASTGAQAVTMAPGAADVVAVEIDTALAAATEVNLLVNGVLDRVDVRWEDARQVELGGAFDTVAVNPPLLPNFGLALPWRADGGPNGCALLEEVLRRVCLAPGGRLAATCTMPGNGSGPDVAWLRALAAEQGLAAVAIPTGVAELHRGSYMARELAAMATSGQDASAADALDHLTGVWESSGIDRLFFCLLTATRTGRAGVEMAPATGADAGAGWWL